MIIINNNINKINDLIYLYCPIGQFIGRIENKDAFLDILDQIKNQKTEGYFVIYSEWDEKKETYKQSVRIEITPYEFGCYFNAEKGLPKNFLDINAKRK